MGYELKVRCMNCDYVDPLLSVSQDTYRTITLGQRWSRRCSECGTHTTQECIQKGLV